MLRVSEALNQAGIHFSSELGRNARQKEAGLWADPNRSDKACCP